MLTEFEAHPWVRGGQLQTLIAYFGAQPQKVKADEYIHVTLPDGDQIELVINHPSGPVKANVYLMHGLGGDSDSAYQLRLTKKLLPLGFRIIRHNHRGNGVHLTQTRGMYHSGSTLDVLACLIELQRRWPTIPLGLIGFSLSGTILLNLLGRHADELSTLGIVTSALTVCAPLDLSASAHALSQLHNKHYDLFFAKTRIAQLLRRNFITSDFIKERLDRPTLRKVDEFITAPYGGFRDADHYYESCSPNIILSQINIDVLMLAAADDPIVPANSVLKVDLGQHVSLQMEASGGHMGFLGRNLTTHGDYRWLDSFVETWVNSHLVSTKSTSKI